MAYSKQTWVNAGLGDTPINADRLNHMEDGIEAATQGRINVLDFGAVPGDPTTDNSPLFKAAIDYALSQGIGEVEVPYDPDPYYFSTAYLTDGTLTASTPATVTIAGVNYTCIPMASNVALRAMGGRVKLKLVNNGMTIGGRRSVTMISPRDSIVGAHDLLVCGFDIDMNKANQPTQSGITSYTSYGVRFIRCMDSTVRDCIVRNTTGDIVNAEGESYAFETQGCVNTSWDNCISYDANGSAFGYNSSYRTTSVNCKAIRPAFQGFTENIFATTLAAGNVLGGTYNGDIDIPVLPRDSQTKFAFCHSKSAGVYGFNNEFGTFTMFGCSSRDSGTYEVTGVESELLMIIGCDFGKGSAVVGGTVGVIVNPAKRVIISACKFENFEVAIYTLGGDSADHATIVGNDYGNCTSGHLQGLHDYTNSAAANTGNVQIGSPIGYPLLPENVFGADHTLAKIDLGAVVAMNMVAANNVTIPPDATVNFPIGSTIYVQQLGAGQTTIVAGVGVNVRPVGAKIKTAAQNAVITLRKRAANDWTITGDAVA